MPANSNNRDIARNVFISVSMFLLTVGAIVYAVIRDSVLYECYGKGNELAHVNLYGAFTVDVIFLVAPLIGGCSAFRLAKSPNSSAKIIGCLLVVMFALFFLQAGIGEWAQYRNDQWRSNN